MLRMSERGAKPGSLTRAAAGRGWRERLASWRRGQQAEQSRMAVFIAASAILVLLALYRIASGINPDSLWLDDQWVGALIRRATLGDFVEVLPPAPLGFLLLVRLMTSVLGWGSWQLQLLPIACFLIQIPLIGWIAWRATGRLSLGLVAAALLSDGGTLLQFSIRVKQYSLESLIVLMLIALAMRSVSRPGDRSFAVVVIAAALAMPFSFTATPVGMVIVNVLALYMLASRGESDRPRKGAIIAGAVCFNIAALGWTWLVQLNQANQVMFDFWSQYYAPVFEASAMWEFTTSHLSRFLTGALPGTLGWLALAAPLGIMLMLCIRQSRVIGLAFLLFYGGCLALSAMGLYPLGGRRLDIFSYPVTILAIVAAAWAVGRWFRFMPQVVLGVVVVNMLLFYPAMRYGYVRNSDRVVVEFLTDATRDDDGVIIGPQSSWAVGCYSTWPVRFVRVEDGTNGFVVVPQRDGAIVLREEHFRDLLRQDEDAFIRQLDPLLEQRPVRVWFLSLQGYGGWVPGVLKLHGYMQRDAGAPSEQLRLFELPSED
jgi:hypothetical protein